MSLTEIERGKVLRILRGDPPPQRVRCGKLVASERLSRPMPRIVLASEITPEDIQIIGDIAKQRGGSVDDPTPESRLNKTVAIKPGKTNATISFILGDGSIKNKKNVVILQNGGALRKIEAISIQDETTKTVIFVFPFQHEGKPNGRYGAVELSENKWGHLDIPSSRAADAISRVVSVIEAQRSGAAAYTK